MIGFRHIAIEGAPGSGKTAIAAALAERLGAKLLLDVDYNPFLDEFRMDMSAQAFQTQIYFLLSRFRLEDELRQPDLFSSSVVTDYFFDRDEVYATITLDQDEMLLYRTLQNHLVSRRALPDLVIFLQLSLDEAARRNREIEPAFLQLITDAYNGYFYSYAKTPLLVVRADSFNPVAREGELEDLVRTIKSMDGLEGQQRLYFTPSPDER